MMSTRCTTSCSVVQLTTLASSLMYYNLSGYSKIWTMTIVHCTMYITYIVHYLLLFTACTHATERHGWMLQYLFYKNRYLESGVPIFKQIANWVSITETIQSRMQFSSYQRNWLTELEFETLSEQVKYRSVKWSQG